MSLVNDMLRDLDKRRKDSSGDAAKVSLTPAPDVPAESSQRPVMIYLIAALLIGAGAIAWFWMQQNGSGTTRDLNIAPRLAVESTIPEVSDSGEEQSEASNTDAGSVPDDASESIAQLESPAEVDSIENPSPPVVTENVTAENSVPQINPDSTPVRDGEQIAAEINQEPVENSDVEPVEGEAAVAAVSRSPVNLEQRPTEDVKNAAALSPEEQDVLAVQKALQLIAENKTIEAYAVLEQEILDNRYAHQARETYAKLLLNEGNLLGALELAESGLALSPNHRGFKKIKARLLIAQGSLTEAVDLLLSRAPPVDSDLEYHEILATAQLASRDYEGALISYTGLVRQDQSQGRWWYGFAASQESLGNTSAARQGYSRAVSLSNLSANLRRRSQERLAVLSQ
ncbi:MAG: hypothetical protein RL839_06690 [Gammaproteobacteria bacterium]